MAEEKVKFKKIFSSKITLFLLLLLFIWLAVNLVGVIYKKHQASTKVEDLKSQVAKLEKSNQEISELIDYFNSGDFLEKQAKGKLNLRKAGEQVIIIEPGENSATTSTVASSQVMSAAPNLPASSAKTESNLVKWWKYFFR